MINIMLHLVLLLVFPLLFPSLINRVKARIAGRQGPSLRQFGWDLRRLFRKGQVISHDTTWIFQVAPTVNLATVLFAGLLVPMGKQPPLVSFPLDFVFFAYLLGFGKFFMILAALDTGSPFEGMGASREATFSALIEPSFFILIGTLTLGSGQTSFARLFELHTIAGPQVLLIYGLALVVLFLIILTEGSRVPVDDPNTHLELTMIHEVMILDHSGPDLGFIFYANALKLVVYSSLVSCFLVPSNQDWPLAYAVTIGTFILIAISIGFVESIMARLRMTHVPMFLISSSVLSLLVLVVMTMEGSL
ncbi:MAG: NADH-quinone oxidoreductase subunit H [SAR324 cluster bacterium]|nr:NADH-quinone oxidoreductase subunit H [SAR324 cluster bacterium]MBF0351254.1 NADH-quinone oxidoreductase subunit H [SAR324 cluster bacterium]